MGDVRNSLAALLALFACVSAGASSAQQPRPEPQRVEARSWKTGKETFSRQTLRIRLDPRRPDYSARLVSSSGRKYLLSVVHNPRSYVKTEHWKIELREVSSSRPGKKSLGKNLLVTDPGGPGRHYFPREDFVGDLYPESGPPVVTIAPGTPLREGFPFYPLTSTRVIRVEGFYLVAQVTGYRFNEADPRKLDYLELVVELKGA